MFLSEVCTKKEFCILMQLNCQFPSIEGRRKNRKKKEPKKESKKFSTSTKNKLRIVRKALLQVGRVQHATAAKGITEMEKCSRKPPRTQQIRAK